MEIKSWKDQRNSHPDLAQKCPQTQQQFTVSLPKKLSLLKTVYQFSSKSILWPIAAQLDKIFFVFEALV